VNSDEPNSQITDAGKQALELTWRRKVAFSVMCLMVFFVLLEVVLTLAGIAPVVETEDPYVGFSSYIPLFETAGHESELRETAASKLAFFNRQTFPGQKQKDSYRVFSVGGSTTYGRPYDDTTSFTGWLRELLPHADPSRKWDVINAGGISYASYRVAKVMEELTEYEPDLFIVYCGHNEFLEHRTYRDLRTTSSVLTAAGGMLSHTRTYAVMHRAWQSDAITPARRPAWQLPAEVITRLDNSVGPQDYKRNETLKKQIQQHYELNLRRMVTMARGAGARILFVVPASNLKDSSPFKSTRGTSVTRNQQQQIEQLYRSTDRLASVGQTQEALGDIDRALAIDPQIAALHYRRGQLLYSSGRYSQSYEAFEAAVNEDICPLRILPDMQDTVRRVAAELSVNCVDFAQLAERESENGIPGNDMFLDHVHPDIRTHRLLALAIIDKLVEGEVVTLSPQWTPDTVDQVTRLLEAGLDRAAHGIALRNLSKVMGWAGKVDEAYNLALKAVELAVDDAETQFQAGIAREGANELPEAEQHYRRAGEIDADFEAVHLNLGVVLGKLERLDEARAEFQAGLKGNPGSPALLSNLATVCELLQDFESATRYRHEAERAIRNRHASDTLTNAPSLGR
jgi:tetratricopeptide (TPR) repeat protein